ncbi:MAG: hypothetical protein R6V04_05510 [bacterium]
MNENLTSTRNINKKIPVHFWIGIFLVAVAWILIWSLSGPRSHLLFFPLWTGYSLTVDSLVWMRKGTSLFTRNKKKFMLLFIISAPCWWLFELINIRTQNWIYLGKEQFTALQYAFYASLNFSTVIPAVFGSAELIGTCKFIKKIKKCNAVSIHNKSLTLFLLIGTLLLLLILLFPKFFYPFVWLSVYLIIDPVNYWLGNPTLLEKLQKGDWKKIITLGCGALLCGFFWEMWNYYAYPKWVYHTPFVQFCHIFEMPILGYIGYIPFSWELYALYQLITKSFKKEKTETFIDIGEN